MNATDELLLHAFSAYIKKETLSGRNELPDGDFSLFMKKAMLHKLLPMAGSTLLRSGILTENQTSLLRGAVLRQTTGQTVRTAEFLKVYGKLLETGAKPLCVKGVVCRSYYPEPDMRPSGDEDLIACEKDFALCRDKLLQLGFTADNTDKNAFEIGFLHPQTGCRIELHNAFFDPKNSLFRTFNDLFENVFEAPREYSPEGVSVFAPKDDIHLLYLILHAYKHFIHAGIGIRQLCDIALFAAGGRFDWNDIFTKCAEVNADVFLNAVLLIGEKYFGLVLTPIAAAYPAFDKELDIVPLLDDVLCGAIYGADSEERQHSATITLNTVAAASAGKQTSVLRSVFPPREKLVKKYPYLEKHPALLPAAWAQRIFSYSKGGNDSSLTVEIGKKRVELMKQYKIIK